jgi:hypothetical protein
MQFEVPREVVEAIAQRAAEIVLEQLPPASESPYLNVDEAAAFLRCKPQRIYELRTSGRLTRITEGGRALVLRKEVELLVDDGLPVARRDRRVA